MSKIKRSQHRFLYIFQTIKMIENELINDGDDIENIINRRIIKEGREFDFILYRLTGCYIPKIVKKNINKLYTPEFVASVIKRATQDGLEETFPKGRICMSSVLGSDSKNSDIWENVKSTTAVSRALNYAKIKNRSNVII